MANSRIAITGSSGFIGSHLTTKLKELGVPTLAISHGLSLTEIVTELKAFQPTALVHLASVFIAEHKPEEIDVLVQSNVGFGVRVFEACRLAGVHRVVVTGSSWQHFGERADVPTNLYGALKNGLEEVGRYYADADQSAVAFLKLYDSFAAGDPRPKLVPHLMKLRTAARAGQPAALDLSAGEQIVDFTHVDNTVAACLAAVEWTSDPAHLGQFQDFKVSSGEPMSLKKFVAMFEDVGGVKLDVRWGARPYRAREIMKPWNEAPSLPGYVPKVSVREGLHRLFEESV